MEKNIQDARVGFVISHPYHLFIYKPLIALLDKPVLIIETRKKTPFSYSAEFYSELPCDYIRVDENQLKLVDQQVDVVFVMTPKHLGAAFKKAKTVIMQYGMAKEYYNYGFWRCRGDLNMMYGPYSNDMIRGHSVSRAVGCIRLDGFTPKKVGGGGLLYIPTYGELSSLGKFLDFLPSLDPTVPIKIKLHHVSEFSDATIIEALKGFPQVTIVDGYKDALVELSEADVVLSDYSGAIFDAVFLDRPVVLFQPGFEQSVKRTDDKSIEIANGAEFGDVLTNQDELIEFFDDLAIGKSPQKKNVDIEKYLSHRGNATPVALDLLTQLINGKLEPSIVQMSLRETYEKLLRRPRVRTFKQAMRGRLSRLVFGK